MKKTLASSGFSLRNVLSTPGTYTTSSFKKKLEENGFDVFPMKGDGSCLFYSLCFLTGNFFEDHEDCKRMILHDIQATPERFTHHAPPTFETPKDEADYNALPQNVKDEQAIQRVHAHVERIRTIEIFPGSESILAFCNMTRSTVRLYQEGAENYTELTPNNGLAVGKRIYCLAFTNGPVPEKGHFDAMKPKPDVSKRSILYQNLKTGASTFVTVGKKFATGDLGELDLSEEEDDDEKYFGSSSSQTEHRKSPTEVKPGSEQRHKKKKKSRRTGINFVWHFSFILLAYLYYYVFSPIIDSSGKAQKFLFWIEVIFAYQGKEFPAGLLQRASQLFSVSNQTNTSSSRVNQLFSDPNVTNSSFS